MLNEINFLVKCVNIILWHDLFVSILPKNQALRKFQILNKIMPRPKSKTKLSGKHLVN